MSDINNWVDLKKSFTQKQEDALWQYFIDHSKVQKNGFLGIMFYIKDVDDFWKRVCARYTGDFQRYDKLEKAEKQASTTAVYMANMASKMLAKVTHIEKNGKLLDKLMLKCYRISRDYIQKYDERN